MAPRPRKPAKTAEEEALERRQQTALDKEIEEQEERLSLFTRKSLGRASLLTGAPKTPSQAAGRATASASPSLMGRPGGNSGISTRSPNVPSSASRR